MGWKKLPPEFYQRKDVVRIARDLIGKILVTRLYKLETAVRIVETEAYAGVADRASHAYGARRTQRNEIMYAEGGYCYVYLCYGIHHLFNVVTNSRDIPHAILIRAGEPIKGMEEMQRRTCKRSIDRTLTRGPGNLSKALGITTAHSGLSLLGRSLFIADDNFRYHPKSILASPRIGVDYAGEDAKLRYRFYVGGNPYVSAKPS